MHPPSLPLRAALLLSCAAGALACSGGGGGGGGPGGGAPPPPAGERRGWELDETNTGLAGVGIDRATLPRYDGPQKPAAGTVISGRRIETALDLSAGDITIERCWVHPTSLARGNSLLVTFDNNHDQAPAPATVTVRDSDIDGSALAPRDVAYSAGFMGIGTVERCHIHGVGSGIAIMHAGDRLPGLVQGNYVHDLHAWGDPTADGSHADGFTVRDYAGPSLTVRDNRLDCSTRTNDTGAFFVQAWAGFIDNLLVQGNLLEGGGYNLILEANAHGYGTHLRAVDNRFAPTGFGPGYVDPRGLDHGWAEWRDNYRDDPAQPEHRGAPVSP